MFAILIALLVGFGFYKTALSLDLSGILYGLLAVGVSIIGYYGVQIGLITLGMKPGTGDMVLFGALGSLFSLLILYIIMDGTYNSRLKKIKSAQEEE